MRVFLNSILSFIGSTSLTDSEYATTNLTEQTYSLATYNALRSVLESREMVSGQLQKLKSFFKIKGVAVGSESAIRQTSQIFIGAGLG